MGKNTDSISKRSEEAPLPDVSKCCTFQKMFGHELPIVAANTDEESGLNLCASPSCSVDGWHLSHLFSLVQPDANHCFEVFLNCFGPGRQVVNLLLLGNWVIQVNYPKKLPERSTFSKGLELICLLTVFPSCPRLDRHVWPTEGHKP